MADKSPLDRRKFFGSAAALSLEHEFDLFQAVFLDRVNAHDIGVPVALIPEVVGFGDGFDHFQERNLIGGRYAVVYTPDKPPTIYSTGYTDFPAGAVTLSRVVRVTTTNTGGAKAVDYTVHATLYHGPERKDFFGGGEHKLVETGGGVC